MNEPQSSGADLARVALAAARAAAKTRPQAKKQQRQQRASRRRGDGRDPMTLGTALGHLAADRGWEAPTAGADVVADWPTIAPELVGKVAAERYDADTGTLHLRPVSPTYAANLRLLGRQLIRRVNDKTGKSTVRALRVLTPGTLPDTAPRPAQPGFTAVKPDPQPTEPLPPHPAYAAALEAIRAAQETTRQDPDQPLRDRYFAGHRDTLREPDPNFADAVEALEAARRAEERDAVRQAAINAARAQRAGRYPTAPRSLGGAA